MQRALNSPPDDTRAYFRGNLVKFLNRKFNCERILIGSRWNSLTVEESFKSSIDFLNSITIQNPFKPYKEELEDIAAKLTTK